MTDIQKMIEEEAREYMYSPKAHTGHYTDVQIEEYRYDGFIDGANFVLSKWQEANRWRKVSEELPEHRNNDYQVLGLLNNGHYITIWIIKGISQIEVFTYHGVTQWKPIE